MFKLAKSGDLGCPDHDHEKDKRRSEKKIYPDIHVVWHQNLIGNPEGDKKQWQMDELWRKRLLLPPGIAD